MRNVYIDKIQLDNYRNFQSFEMTFSEGGITIFVGNNGVGKTNLLEAISLFSPGKGLRNAKFDEICKFGTVSWHSKILLYSNLGICELTNNFNKNNTKRFIEYNKEKISATELSKFASILWLTPQMEGVLSSGSSDRRKFLDRVVYSFNHDHARNVNKYNYYLQERMRILQLEHIDTSWLNIVENHIADYAILIAKARVDTVNKLNEALCNLDMQLISVKINIDGDVEQKIRQNSYDENTIDFITNSLKSTRTKDKFSGKANFGTHRSDFLIYNATNTFLAQFCSTGEQKAMLVSLVIAQLSSIISITKAKPILLLDEVFTHLDENRREYLINFLVNNPMQVVITTNDLEPMNKIVKHSQICHL